MNVQEYKQRLLDLEARLSTRVAEERKQGREQVVDSPRDTADDSVTDEAQSEDFTEAELDATVLQQVREALQRIEDGTFGRCVVDGEPIEPKRLEAIPWTPYGVKHQRQLEAASPRTTTLSRSMNAGSYVHLAGSVSSQIRILENLRANQVILLAHPMRGKSFV